MDARGWSPTGDSPMHQHVRVGVGCGFVILRSVRRGPSRHGGPGWIHVPDDPGDRHHQALRAVHRGPGPRPRGSGRGGLRTAGPERRRKDDDDQNGHRDAPAGRGLAPGRGASRCPPVGVGRSPGSATCRSRRPPIRRCGSPNTSDSGVGMLGLDRRHDPADRGRGPGRLRPRPASRVGWWGS